MKYFIILACFLFVVGCGNEPDGEKETFNYDKYWDEIHLKGKGRDYIENYLFNTLKVKQNCIEALKLISPPSHTASIEAARIRWDWFGDDLRDVTYIHNRGFGAREEYPSETINLKCVSEYADTDELRIVTTFDYLSDCDVTWDAFDYEYIVDEDRLILWHMGDETLDKFFSEGAYFGKKEYFSKCY